MRYKMILVLAAASGFSLVAFQNCSSKTTIAQQDAAASTSGSGGNSPAPAPTPAPQPFMFQNAWKPLPANAPGPLVGHTAVYTGTKVVIWGGQNSASTMAPAGGYVLDVATNTWSTITGGPSAREKHTAVWTGSKMIVWGGINNITTGAATNDGGIYNPQDGTWTQIPAFGLSARANHVAVWTGTEMIVWGGVDGANNALGDGAIYNPATNSWRAMSSTGALSARKHSSAVWTGSKMLVWGGANGLGTVFMNDGALYDPATDKWSALTQVTPPSARQWASVDIAPVNGLVFIFGGISTAALGAGFSLDLNSGLWSILTATGAPSARYGHTETMTSEGLIIFGGTDGTNFFNNGAIYY